MLFIDTLRAQGRIFFVIYLYFPLIQVRLKVPLNMFVEHTIHVCGSMMLMMMSFSIILIETY